MDKEEITLLEFKDRLQRRRLALILLSNCVGHRVLFVRIADMMMAID